MHLILTGSTGLVGSAALHAMMRNAAITRISVFARSPVPQVSDAGPSAAKCTVYTHADFSSPPSGDILASLRDARGCVWALGLAVNEVDAPTYERITVQWPCAWLRALVGSASAPFNFVYVSGEGATLHPGLTTTRMGRVKGEAEKALLDIASENKNTDVYSARPGAIDRVGHTEVQKYAKERPGFQKVVEKTLFPVMRPAWKGMIIPTVSLGDALVGLASGDGTPVADGAGVSENGRVLQNVALRRLAGL